MTNYAKNITPEAMEEEEKTPRGNQRNSAFDEKNYLNVRLKKDEDSKTLRIRLLPVDAKTNSPFKQIYMHTIQLPEAMDANKSWKSFVCLSKTEDIDHETFGHDCPFCELNHSAYNEFKNATEAVDKERWKKISVGAKASEVCVVRCIERGHEEDGPKFWKFTVRDDGKDPKHIIKALWKVRRDESIEEAKLDNKGELPEDFEPENILDIYTGKDLQVTISAVYDKEGKRTNKTSVAIVDYGKPRPLSPDEDEIEEWVNDKKVWSDVFVAKPYEYLSIILEGEYPYFDKTQNKWVPRKAKKEDEEEEKKEKAAEVDKKISAAERKIAKSSVDEEEEEVTTKRRITKRPDIIEDEPEDEPEEDDAPDDNDLPF